MNVIPEKFMENAIKSLDSLCIATCARKSTPEEKQRRRYMSGRKKIKEDKTAKGVVYEPGGFSLDSSNHVSENLL